MLPRNSKLAGQIVKSLKGMPKTQRSTAILAMEDYYKHVEGKEATIHPNTKPLIRTERRVPHPKVKLHEFDPEIYSLLGEEAMRQKKSIDLIASSNVPIPDMNESTGHLSNKSAPGYPNARFFNGDHVLDKVEKICYDRALKAFNLYPEEWSVNVQALSGSIANLCAFNALVKPGETILALDTKLGGGHHTHGLKDESNKGSNFYSQVWNIEHYYVNNEGMIDYENAMQRAQEVKPKLII
mmetsp:Transcript_41069/g.47258  ORF Transcript_41069/g.47258 Transcript_41069/m.47258 type:complete len:240 (+) Transcript_41069:18-737(+)